MEANHWIILGLVLLIGEVFTLDFSLACFGLACLAAAVMSALGLGLYWQLGTVIVVIVALMLTLRPFALKYLIRNSTDLKSNMDALIGRETTVFSVDGDDNKKARAKTDADEWTVHANAPLKNGDKVKILKIDGNILIVKKEESK